MPSLPRIISALLLPLATARLTTLITEDQITAPARDAAFSLFDQLPPNHPIQRLQIPYLLTCNRCISVYTSALLLALLPTRLRPLINTLAISQLALTALDATDALLAPTSRHTPDFDFSLPQPETGGGARGTEAFDALQDTFIHVPPHTHTPDPQQ